MRGQKRGKFSRSIGCESADSSETSNTEAGARVFWFPRFGQIFGKPLEALG
jgi:hypothetical protein